MSELWLPPKKAEPKAEVQRYAYLREMDSREDATEWCGAIEQAGAQVVAMIQVDGGRRRLLSGPTTIVVYRHDHELDFEELC